MSRRFAMKITTQHLPIIMKLNKGLEPDDEVIDQDKSYWFVTPSDKIDFRYNRILSHEEFFALYPKANREVDIQIVHK